MEICDIEPTLYWEMRDQIESVANMCGKSLTNEEIDGIILERLNKDYNSERQS